MEAAGNCAGHEIHMMFICLDISLCQGLEGRFNLHSMFSILPYILTSSRSFVNKAWQSIWYWAQDMCVDLLSLVMYFCMNKMATTFVYINNKAHLLHLLHVYDFQWLMQNNNFLGWIQYVVHISVLHDIIFWYCRACPSLKKFFLLNIHACQLKCKSRNWGLSELKISSLNDHSSFKSCYRVNW